MGAAAAGIAADARRRVETSSALVFAGSAVGVGGLLAANGGYFPGSWGWATLGFAWAVTLALLLRRDVALSRLEVAFAAALAAFAGWYLLSSAWSSTVPQSVFEAERAFVYPAGVAAVLLVARSADVAALLGGVLTAVAAVDVYALGTRLFPERIGSFDAVAGYRLTAPVGYWNGLGTVTVVALFLALGFALRSRAPAVRALAGFAGPLLAATLYFTYSRGSLIVLAAGLVVALALDHRRLGLVTGTLLLALPAAAAVWLASRRDALTTVGAPLSDASHQGHGLALIVLLLSVVSAAIAAEASVSAIRVPRAVRRTYTGVLVSLVLAAIVVGLAHYGGPSGAVRRGWHSFTAPPVQANGNLNERLHSLSANGRIELWHAAVAEARAHPVLGGGAGSYEQWWNAHRAGDQKVRDAHSLYLETWAELGPPGLLLLVAALVVPLVAAVRVRRRSFAAFAAGAYVAFLLHAAGDWDWELSGVTLAALLCGAALLLLERELEDPAPARVWPRRVGVGLAVAVAAASLVVVVGNTKLTRAGNAAAAGKWTQSARLARSAADWMPWSSEPWRLLGEAQLGAGETASARSSFRKAIAKDPREWRLWFDLARAGQTSALARAKALNPRSPEIAALAAEIG